MSEYSDAGHASVVTGGASGIGYATVEMLVNRGHFVYIADRDEEKGVACQQQFGDRVEFFPMDVTSEEQFQHLGERIAHQHKHLHSFVNNAGAVGSMGPVTELTLEDFERSNDVLLKSVFLGTRLAARIMMPQGNGRIVNISSIAGMVAGYSPHLYAATKAAVIHFSQSVAIELIEKGIQVNVLCPGATKTPIITGVSDERWLTRAEKVSVEMEDDQPMPRIGNPEEIAAGICWLVCDAPDFLVGHPLVIDGGCVVGRPWRQQPEFMRNYHVSQ